MVPFEYPGTVMGSRRHPGSEANICNLTVHGGQGECARRTQRSDGQYAPHLLPRLLQAFSQVLQAFLQLKVRREAFRLGMILVMVHLSLPAVYGA